MPIFDENMTEQEKQEMLRQMENPVVPRTQLPPPPEEQGFFGGLMDRIGSGVSDIVSDPNFKDKLIIGLSGMSMNPNQALMQMAQGNIENRRKKKQTSVQNNKTLQFLRSKGVDEATLQSLKDNPEMLMAYAQQLLKPSNQPSSVREYEYAKKNGYTGTFDEFKTLSANKTASIKSYAPVAHPETGQLSMPTFNPNDGTTSYVPIEGAFSMTAAEKARLETNEQVFANDRQKAKDAAAEAMKQSSSIQAKLPLYLQAIKAIDDGADSGIIQDMMPALNEATAILRSAANQLGITVINSATFGALNEKELDLILSTELPLKLGPKELREYIERKYEAQVKLANLINAEARKLSSEGMTYSRYIQEKTGVDIPTELPNIKAKIDDSDVERIE